MCEFLARNVPG